MGKALEALVTIQKELKAPKDQNAGRYRYRNIEDINQAVKPLAEAHGCAVVYSDVFEDGVCVSTCRLISEDDSIEAAGCAYIDRQPKHMSIEQASGAASSYARKYAACGLFAIDSSEHDPDRTNAQNQPSKPVSELLSELQKAKARMWSAIQRYAELQGRDPKEILANVQASSDWEESAEFFNRCASEFESQIGA